MEKKNVKICDVCNERVAIGICEICKKDVCSEDGLGLNINIGTFQIFCPLNSCKNCYKTIARMENISLPNELKEQLITIILNNMTVENLKEEKEEDIEDNYYTDDPLLNPLRKPYSPFKKWLKGGKNGKR